MPPLQRRVVAELHDQISDLETTLANHLETPPDGGIFLLLPGLGVVLGAWMLGEFEDDRIDTPVGQGSFRRLVRS